MQPLTPLLPVVLALAAGLLGPFANGSQAQQPKISDQAKPAPDVRAARYGPHERNVLDVWKAHSDRPTPLVVFIHGGGFRGGSKENLSADLLRRCLQAGISVAAINYRLTDTVPFPAPMLDGARAVQFLRSKAREWNLDPTRIAATGGSAGAGISLWVAFHDDLADPRSDDPVARQSSRLACVAVVGAQTTYDPREIRKLIGGRAHEHPALLPFYGLKADEIDSPRAHKLYEQASPMTYLTADDPPVFLYYSEAKGPLPADARPGQGIHHPNFGVGLKQKMDALKIECVLRHADDYRGKGPRNAELDREMVAFFTKYFAARPTAQSRAGTWKAGGARVCITPDRPMWMSGYAARTRPAEGKLQDLWAKALALEDERGHRAVLVTLDLVGIDRALSLAVREELRRKHHLALSHIVLATSHTHCGPVVRGNLSVMYNLDADQQRLVEEYGQALQAKLVAVAGEALGKLTPVRLARGKAQATFAANRRNNKEADAVKLREAGLLKGPVDHEVAVLTAHTADGKLFAVAAGYACHATTLDFYQWSGDYPGFAQAELENAHPGTLALFWAGCGADINPMPRRSVALAEQHGHELAQSVETALRAPLTPIEGDLGTAYTEIELPFADLPTREQLVQDSTGSNRYAASRAKFLLKEIERNGSLRGTYPYPVQVWQMGSDLTFVVLGGEVVVDYALRLKKEVGEGKTWIAGYANDVMAYIPCERVLKEGGYEGGGAMVYYGLPTVWRPGVEERIVSAVHEQVRKARSAAARP